MKNYSGRRSTRYYILFASILLLAASLVWQELLAGDGKDISPPIVDTAPSSTAQPTSLTETTARLTSTPNPLVGATAVPTRQQSSHPLWVAALRDVRLIGGLQRPDEKVPQGSILRVLGYHSDQLLVYYAGDGIDRKATEGLVNATDVAPVKAPKWVMVRWTTELRSTPEISSPTVTWLQRGAVLETLDDNGETLRVFSPGNGRERDAVEGWVDTEKLVAAGPTLAAESRGARWLDKEGIDRLRLGNGVWIQIPYRTQLDGSPSAEANCGPASIGMILEYFGVPSTNDELRSVAHRLQGTSGSDTGFAIEYLQQAVELLGMRGYDLYSGKEFRKWSFDDLRWHITNGHPVVPQLRYRMMPGRDHSDYWEDHYVVINGVQGNDFIYSDPTDIEGPGHGRLMSVDDLERAWSTSYFPYAAFAVGRRE